MSRKSMTPADGGFSVVSYVFYGRSFASDCLKRATLPSLSHAIDWLH